MIIFLIGTTAELIKVSPVLKRIKAIGGNATIWSTGQQPVDINEWLLENQESASVCFRNIGSPNLSRRSHVLPWLLQITKFAYIHRWDLRHQATRGDGRPALVVHGDTMTTSWGIFLSKLLNVDLIHIEAGLRSGSLVDPFPEEISRRLVSRFAKNNYAPGLNSVEALRKAPGRVIFTEGNTVVDATSEMTAEPDLIQPEVRYLLVSLHRSELLGHRSVFEATIESLINTSKKCQMTMVVDSLTEERLKKMDSFERLKNSGIQLMPKMSYGNFQKLLRNSSGVITDSGGLQEECAALGIPCLIHRRKSERSDGLGKTASLTNWDSSQFAGFSNQCLNAPPRRQTSYLGSPSDIIVRDLVGQGYIKNRDNQNG